jgi:hypothetical protein
VEVTLVDANHCPGAVQLLFRLPSGASYVHCGDMRFTPALMDSPALQRFTNPDALFLDTTYCAPRCACVEPPPSPWRACSCSAPRPCSTPAQLPAA